MLSCQYDEEGVSISDWSCPSFRYALIGIRFAREIHQLLRTTYDVYYDQSGSIGKRYARMDEIGTPFCITVDYDGLEDGTVTFRDTDTADQRRVKIDDIESIARGLASGKLTFADLE